MKDPNPSFAALITAIKERHPTFGYLHVIHARVDGAAIREIKPEENDDFLRQIWNDKIYLSCGGYTREDAIETADKKGGLVVFGRSFISNVRFLLPSVCNQSRDVSFHSRISRFV